jgi:hypothetical protein
MKTTLLALVLGLGVFPASANMAVEGQDASLVQYEGPARERPAGMGFAALGIMGAGLWLAMLFHLNSLPDTGLIDGYDEIDLLPANPLSARRERSFGMARVHGRRHRRYLGETVRPSEAARASTSRSSASSSSRASPMSRGHAH